MINVIFNGSIYHIPTLGDSGYAQGSGNLSSYLAAIAAGTLQTTGGSFTLSAPVNFGATYGLLTAYLSSTTASPATVGAVRLAASDEICWGAGNLALAVNGSSQLTFNGKVVLTTGTFPLVEYREVYIAGTAKDNYTGSLTVINMVDAFIASGKNLTVSVNGLMQDVSFDYAETSTTSITFNAPVNLGDRISLRWATF